MEVFEGLARTGVPLFVLDESEGPDIQPAFAGFKNMTLLRPRMQKAGYSVFHAKLWLLKFKGFLRVVVGTANNHVGDWALWMNAFWYQDFA